jgi:hypothetical protein
VLVGAADGVVDDAARVFAEPAGGQAVPEDSVWVLAYRGSTCSRMASSMKSSDRPEAV